MQKDGTPTTEEADVIQKLESLKDVCKFHFFRWKKVLGRDGLEWSLPAFSNVDKFVRYKLTDDGNRVKGRGPTMTAKLYKKEAPGQVKDKDGMVYPEQWHVTTPFYNQQMKQLTQAELRAQLIPAEATKREEDNGEAKFLADVEPILYMSKIRWTEQRCALVTHVPQSDGLQPARPRSLSRPVKHKVTRK